MGGCPISVEQTRQQGWNKTENVWEGSVVGQTAPGVGVTGAKKWTLGGWVPPDV